MNRAKVISLAEKYFRAFDKVRGKTWLEAGPAATKREAKAYDALMKELGTLKRAVAIPLPNAKFVLVVKKNGHIYLYDSV